MPQSIDELLREGQEILVQVTKEPIAGKGARITTHVTLPGRYLVYMPGVDHVGVSRRIEDEDERARLREHRSRRCARVRAASSCAPRARDATRSEFAGRRDYLTQPLGRDQQARRGPARRRSSTAT